MKRRPRSPGPAAAGIAAAVLLVGLSGFANAQQGGDSQQPATPLLFALGMNDPSVSNGSVNDIRMPFGYTLIQPDGRSWGLRLRLIVYAGIYDLNFANATTLDVRFQSLAATPGVEFLLPVGRGWTLKPFTEIGYARDFDQDVGFGVWSVGMRTLTEWQQHEVQYRFGTMFQYLSTFQSDLGLSDDFFELMVGLDVGLPLGFDIAGQQAFLSPYAIRHQYIDALIARPEGAPIEIRYDNEIGLAFGTRPKIKLGFITLPRIGIGYRWGPNVSGWRLNFGFPF
jgi:hypothetical protein